MENNLLLILLLLLIVSLLSVLSRKIHISYPIFLVIAGLAISFIPGLPRVSLNPDIVFVIFLPPLLYAAAWETSWHQFWKYKRAIGLLAIGLVIFTATAVAFVSHALIPNFSLALGFVLGGIISPPDAIAATSILRGLPVPKRVVTILEGESLVNDATSLTVFRFALATVATGNFVMWRASAGFFIVAIMGIVVGLAIAFVIYFMHRRLSTTPGIDSAISLISPFLMYITAEKFHFSGVLAAVSGGLFLSYHSQTIFSYESRIQLMGVWNTLVFLLNGIVFILIGLQLPGIIDGLNDYSITEAILYAVIISVVTIIVRIVWVFPGTYVPRILSRTIREREKGPGAKLVFILAWSGMRGVVSLASALAIPLALASGEAFPHRNLILFITFVVILFTLVLQGLSLPFLIRFLKINAQDGEEEQLISINRQLAVAVLKHLDTTHAEEIASNELFQQLKSRHEAIVKDADKRLSDSDPQHAVSPHIKSYRKLLLDLIELRRSELGKMKHAKKFEEELLRKKTMELDLEEARIRSQMI